MTIKNSSHHTYIYKYKHIQNIHTKNKVYIPNVLDLIRKHHIRILNFEDRFSSPYSSSLSHSDIIKATARRIGFLLSQHSILRLRDCIEEDFDAEFLAQARSIEKDF